jgi:hypothetical protein
MSFGGRVSDASGGRVTGGTAPAKNAHKKYCSILQYIQHNNRELYDTINDICPALTGIFSLKSFGASPGKRDLTMLMPVKGSEMHKEIVSLAYGGRELEAIAMIKSCLLYKHIVSLKDLKQGETIRTAHCPEKGKCNNVVVDTSGGFVKIGGAKIIADENFAMLYTDAKFHVYLLESGILMTTPGSEQKDDTISGGAWKELRADQEADASMRTPAGLAKNALIAHLAHLGVAENTSKSAGWLLGNPNDVFYRWGISLAKFLERKHGKLAGLVRKLYHPNPMCVIPFTALFVPKSVFDEWLNDDEEKNGQPRYSYAEYLSFVSKEPLIAEAVAGPVIAAAVKSVHPDKSGQKSMNETARIVVSGYNTAYANDAELPWATKLFYDEAVFVMNTYVRTAALKANGWQAKCQFLSNIIVTQYSSPGKRWLTETGDARADTLPSGAMHCKLLEFVLSESFMYPNGYCARFNRPSHLAESAEDAMKLANMQDIKCADFTGELKKFFG